jgi:serine/threonine protein kinase
VDWWAVGCILYEMLAGDIATSDRVWLRFLAYIKLVLCRFWDSFDLAGALC